MSDPRALKEKAGQLFTRGKFAKAAEAYEEYCAADRKDHQSRLRCGDAWSKAGKKDKAIGAYAMAAEGFARDGFLPRAIAASKLVLELDPAHKGVQKMLADLYAQKSGGGRKAAAAPAAEMEISRKVEAPVTSNFANRADAIDLDAPVAAAPKKPARVQTEAPSPMNRADALELPEYEIPMEDGPSSVGGMSAQRGPSPQRREDAIEIETVDEGPTGPKALENTTIDIELSGASQPVSGEVEIPIEGTAIPEAAPLELEVVPQPSAPTFELTEEVAEAPPPAPPPDAVVVGEALPTSYELDAPIELTPKPPSFELDPPLELTAKKPSEPAVYELSTEEEEAEVVEVIEPEPETPAALPPGLKRRTTGEVPAVAPAGIPQSSPSGSRIWLPPTFTPPPTRENVAPAIASVAPQNVPSSSESSSDLERSMQAFMQFDPDAGTAKKTPKADFTELDLDTDSLLHAVEAAAVASSPSAVITGEEIMEAPEEIRPGALPKIPLFSDLPEDAFIALFEKCPLLRFEEGQLVFEQGDKADAFYVICGGAVRVFRMEGENRRDLATLEEGSFFGEMALLSEAPRSASVEAAGEDVQVLSISAEILTELSAAHPSVSTALKKFCRQRMLSNLMNSAALFAPFNRNDRRDLVQKFRARDVKRGDVLVKQGQASDGLYVVLSGEVEIEAAGAKIATLKEGQLFGEMSLLTRSPASATVRATRHTSLLRLPKQDFDSLILSHPQVLEHVAELIDERQKADAKRSAASGLV
ncbi:MAG: cyclic nucleotide-binding domain-containing protein [Archangium sp.]